MSRQPLPANVDAERAVIGACLLSDAATADVARILTPADLYSPTHQAVYAAILAAHDEGRGRVDMLDVHQRITGADVDLAFLHELQNATPTISNAAQYAETIVACRLGRELVHAASTISTLGMGAITPDAALEATDQARDAIARLDMPAGRGAPDPDIDSFTNSVDTTYDWLIPDFLERRDRMLVTAGEGAGKSVLLAQIAVMTAAGIHPWTWKQTAPRNVLLVDLENSARLVTRRLARLRSQAGTTLDPQRLRVHVRPSGIDLTSRTDRRWLIDRCEANAAELLVIGPAYRMSSGVAAKGDIGGEDQARNVTKALDEIRNLCGVALLMETHAPHGGIGGRDLRPFGSSVWLRWPEFGIGISADKDDATEKRFNLIHWRGPRDERLWPKALHRDGSRWPWTPEMPTGTYRSGGAA